MKRSEPTKPSEDPKSADPTAKEATVESIAPLKKEMAMDDNNNAEFERQNRDSGNFMRFGKRNDRFMRFGRADALIRFGKRGGDQFMRFGKKKRNDPFMRFGKRSDAFMRFGRSSLPPLTEEEAISLGDGLWELLQQKWNLTNGSEAL